MLRSFLIGLALLCCASATLLAIWIVIPFYPLWTIAVGASEWSLWLGALALVGVALGALARANGSRWALPAALLIGLPALILSVLPLAQALPVARQHGAELSLGRYLWGWRSPPTGSPPETVTFATVDGQPLLLDVYQPSASAPQPRPAIVVVHGGSWSGGDKSDFPQWNNWLTGQGYAIFDVQYRLTPQPNWQTATGDVKCAIGWVRQHAAQYNIDPQRIALLGRSAGAHLALLAAYAPNEQAAPPSCAVGDTSVKLVVDFYGPTDLEWGYNATADENGENGSPATQSFLGGTPRSVPAAYTTASPINHVRADSPPTLLLHGGRDQLVSPRHSEMLADRLQAAGVPYQTVYIPYGQHGFDYNFNGWSGQISQSALRQFLQTYLQL